MSDSLQHVYNISDRHIVGGDDSDDGIAQDIEVRAHDCSSWKPTAVTGLTKTFVTCASITELLSTEFKLYLSDPVKLADVALHRAPDFSMSLDCLGAGLLGC